MAADPVVSPADTIRRDDVLRHYTAVCRCEWSEDEFTRTMTSDNCVIHGTVPDPLAALLAVGERDRRQIARLTEALKRIAYGNVEQRGSYQVSFADASNFARAVLADEEDAHG